MKELKQSSLGILDQIRKREEAVNVKVASIQEPSLSLQVDTLMSLYRTKLAAMKELIPRVEQLKGIVAGIKLCVPIMDQQKVYWKNKLEDDKDTFTHTVNVLGQCATTTARVVQAQREDLLKTAGRLEEMSHTLLGILDQVEKTIDHHQKQVEKQDDEDETDKRLEEGRKSRAKKTTTRKKK
jgi:hypothetical protein